MHFCRIWIRVILGSPREKEDKGTTIQLWKILKRGLLSRVILQNLSTKITASVWTDLQSLSFSIISLWETTSKINISHHKLLISLAISEIGLRREAYWLAILRLLRAHRSITPTPIWSVRIKRPRFCSLLIMWIRDWKVSSILIFNKRDQIYNSQTRMISVSSLKIIFRPTIQSHSISVISDSSITQRVMTKLTK